MRKRRHWLHYPLAVYAAGAAFVGITVGLLTIALTVQSGIRGYINGEALWSKAQQDSVYLLERYAATADPVDFLRYERRIGVPLAARRARVEMEASDPDLRSVRDDLKVVGIHSEDMGSMVWLFRWFHETPVMAPIVDIWRAGDVEIAEIAAIGEAIHAGVRFSGPGSTTLEDLRSQLAATDQRVRPLADSFSEKLNEIARVMDVALIVFAGAVISASVLFLGMGLTSMYRRLRHTHKHFSTTFEQAAVGMAHLAKDGTFLRVNRQMAKILGTTPEAMVGASYADYTHPADLDASMENFSKLLAGNLDDVRTEKRYIRNDGSVIWVKLTATVVRDRSGEPLHIVTVVEDISESREMARQISYQATHDALTGLWNRYEFERRLHRLLQDAWAGHRDHALLYLDLDQFKLVNDTCGHPAGDTLLQRLSKTLTRELRTGDTVARLGGDEFGVLLENCDLARARGVAEKLRHAVETFRFHWAGRSFHLGVSIGVVAVDTTSESAESVLAAADTACYAAKDAGRNRIHVYTPEDTVIKRRTGEMRWVARINEALHSDRFELFAQTVTPTDAAKAAGHRYEVLLRLRNPDGSLELPGAFLPAAERFNLATQVDHWVVSRTLKLLAGHPEHVADLDLCSINLSGHSLSSERTVDYILEVLDQTGVPAEKVCFEVTETVAVRDLEQTAEFMQRLRERGCHFALDDFGTGVSSFAYLSKLPVDFLKIDGTFVRGLPADPLQSAIVRSINEVAHVLGKQTIAEFVENTEILTTLREFGVDYAQGYGIGRPAPLSDLLAVTGRRHPVAPSRREPLRLIEGGAESARSANVS